MARRDNTRRLVPLALAAAAAAAALGGCSPRESAQTQQATSSSEPVGSRPNRAKPQNAADALPAGAANPNPNMESRPMMVPGKR